MYARSSISNNQPLFTHLPHIYTLHYLQLSLGRVAEKVYLRSTSVCGVTLPLRYFQRHYSSSLTGFCTSFLSFVSVCVINPKPKPIVILGVDGSKKKSSVNLKGNQVKEIKNLKFIWKSIIFVKLILDKTRR